MIRNRVKTRVFSTLMAVAIFAAGLMMASHHHGVDEAKAADHCAVCIAGHQVRTGDDLPVSNFAVARDSFYSSLCIFEETTLRTSPILFGKLSQAPPAV